VQDLSVVVQGESIFEAQRFAGVPLSEEAKALLAQNQGDDAGRSLNRAESSRREFRKFSRGGIEKTTNGIGQAREPGDYRNCGEGTPRSRTAILSSKLPGNWRSHRPIIQTNVVGTT
jgi:hypothetical protein